MKRSVAFSSLVLPLGLFMAACSGTPQTPVSPSAAVDGNLAANADGSTLKVTAPALLSPSGGETLNTRRPTFVIQNVTSVNGVAVAGLSYRVQLLNEDGSVAGERTTGETGGQTSVQADTDLEYERNFNWRARAELEGAVGPWSGTASFRTPNRPGVGGGGGPETGQPRNIDVNEAVNIIFRIYSDMRWDIGGRSSRDQRNLYLEAAVAALHFGHARFNPAGPDSDWCIKTGGPGRPQADDVIVRCGSRDAWDLVVSIGANGYHWHTDYIGRLPGVQQVYAPSRSALGVLGR